MDHSTRFDSNATAFGAGLTTKAQSASIRKKLSTIDALRLFVAPLMVVALFLSAVDIADAKRMGGGRSFGSKQSYSKNYSKDTSSKKDAAGGMQQNAQQPSRGMFGGMGGMLGGMLMGGLIGSMLFGGGFGGGLGILELLLFAGLGFFLFKFIRSKMRAQAGQGTMARDNNLAYAGAQAGGSESTAFAGWGALQSNPAPAQQEPAGPGRAMPSDVDEAEFLEGAKALYGRLQNSWDRRDLNDIRTFASPDVMAEVERQAADDPTPGTTEILMLDARILEVRSEGQETVISVLFDAMLREDADAVQSSQVREVWHISRDDSTANSEWKLEGIQQLEV